MSVGVGVGFFWVILPVFDHGVPMRGGRSECFFKNYEQFYAKDRPDDLRTGALQALIIFIDQKIRNVKLFSQVKRGHYTSGGKVAQILAFLAEDLRQQQQHLFTQRSKNPHVLSYVTGTKPFVYDPI